MRLPAWKSLIRILMFLVPITMLASTGAGSVVAEANITTSETNERGLPDSAPDASLVTQEIRYRLPEAGEVFLVWGVNGWNTVPEGVRPQGTVIKKKLMHTMMVLENETFVAALRVPLGARIDYGFLVTKKPDGSPIHPLWIEQSHPVVASKTTVTEHETRSVGRALLQVKGLPTLLEVGQFLLLGGLVFLMLGQWIRSQFREDNPDKAIRVLILLTLVGLALRLWVAGTSDRLLETPARLIGDEPRYDDLAVLLLEGQFFPWPGSTPIYPLFLAGCYFLFGHSYAQVLIVQAFAGSATIPLTYALARRFTEQRSSLLAAMLVALHPALIYHTGYLYTEAIYVPLLLLALLVLLRALETLSYSRLMQAGAMFGFVALIRPATALLPLALPFMAAKSWNLKTRFAAVAVFSAIMIAVIAPWSYHNYRTHHVFMPFSLSLTMLWVGSPEFYHLMHEKENALLAVWDEELNPARNGGHNPMTIEGDRYFNARAVASIRAEPGVYALYSLQKLAYFWLGHPGANWDWPFNFEVIRTYFTAWQIASIFGARLAFVGAALLSLFVLRHSIRRFLPLLILCLYFMFFHAILAPSARYSEPLYPILAVIMAAAEARLTQTLSGRRSRAIPIGQNS